MVKMEGLRKCAGPGCDVWLEFGEGHIIEKWKAPDSANPYSTSTSTGGDKYCDECYKNINGETIDDIQKKNDLERQEILKNIITIRERLKLKDIFNTNINEQADIICIIDSLPKLFGNGKTCKYVVSDDLSTIDLILWNEDINKYSLTLGKIYEIKGFMKVYNDDKQIILGYYGAITEVK
jgi:hypothetical protein